MIDHEIIKFAKERIEIEIAEQEKKIAASIQRIAAEMSGRGMLRSSMYIVAVQKECCDAVDNRADLVWKMLLRAITTVGIEYEENVEQQLREVCDYYFPEHMNGLKYRVVEAAQMAGLPDIMNRIPDEVGSTRQSALARIHSEIKLFVLAMKKSPIPSAANAPQVHIHNSTIGSVQTGHQSTSTVSMQSNTGDKDALIRVLDLISQALVKVDNWPTQDRGEIIELVNEGKGELSKEQPNLSKVKAYLPIIGDALKVVGELRPAYESLKTAAALFGVTLP